MLPEKAKSITEKTSFFIKKRFWVWGGVRRGTAQVAPDYRGMDTSGGGLYKALLGLFRASLGFNCSLLNFSCLSGAFPGNF